MAQTLLKGNAVNTVGELPAVGSFAPNFELISTSLTPVRLQDFAGKKVILNIFPSVDTGVCAASVRAFNTQAASLENTVVVCISRDLPFAQKRFCGAEGIENVVMGAEYRNFNFSTDYGVLLKDGGLSGLMARAIVILDTEARIVYTELVSEITTEPNYEAAIAAL